MQVNKPATDLVAAINAMADLINDFTNSGFILECLDDDSGDVYVDGGEDVGVKIGERAIEFLAGALAARKKYYNVGFSTHVDLLITRHPAFTEYLKDLGFSWGKEVAHASPGELSGKTVLTSGMPLHLGAKCKHIITVPLDIPADLRGQELNIEQVREYATEPKWFKILGGNFPPQQI